MAIRFGIVAWRILKLCAESLALEDLRSTGAHYTWWNSQYLNPIHMKLDRAMVNSNWLMNLDMTVAHFGNNGLSDHNPVFINTGYSLPKPRNPFQFLISCLSLLVSMMLFGSVGPLLSMAILCSYWLRN